MPTPPRISPLQFLLLIQLEASPKYGYEMLKSIKEAFEGVWEPKTGTLYPALKSLERRELIELLVVDSVDFYKITEKGLRFLEQVGSNQESSARFSARFLTVLIKWISPELKKKIISSFSWMAGDDTNMFGNVIAFFDEGVDRNTRLMFLKGMRRKMSQRLEELDKSISELEAQS
jgi:DNA-binding PadR family transcriptional regulator